MGFKILNISDIDCNAFMWERNRKELPVPPCAVKFKGKVYKVSNFTSTDENYLFTEVGSIEDLINLSTSFYGDISMGELSNIASICNKFKADFNKIILFKKNNIKSNSIPVLIKSALLPENILSYIDTKVVPLKTLSIIVVQSDNVINFINSYLENNIPSVSEFIQFVNHTADFKELVEVTPYSKDFQFPNRKSEIRLNIEKELAGINKIISPVTCQSVDMFETSQIVFTFKTSSLADYNNIIKSMSNGEKAVGEFFNRLKENDIY